MPKNNKLQRAILANARYWLRVLEPVSQAGLLPESDLRGAARALEATLTEPTAWELTKDLALALHPHMEQRGYWADWDAFLQILAAHARQQADETTEAEVCLRRAAIQRQRGDYPAAVLSCRRAWLIFRRDKDRLGLARAYSQLGDLHRLQGRFWRAEALCKAALECFGDSGSPVDRAHGENRLGLVYYDQGVWARALPHLERAETIWRQVGDRHGLAKTLHNLGTLHRRSGDPEKALACFEEAIQHYRAVGDEIHAARLLQNIGNVYLRKPDLPRAEAAYLQAEAVLKGAGDRLELAGARHNLGIVYTRLGNWLEAERCFERALEEWRSRQAIWDLANTLGELANLYHAQGISEKACATLEEAWRLVNERSEPNFDLLRQELAERRASYQKPTV